MVKHRKQQGKNPVDDADNKAQQLIKLCAMTQGCIKLYDSVRRTVSEGQFPKGSEGY